jgi:Putative zinc ribbon domain
MELAVGRDKTLKHCQSCGMPLARDERGGGTNADGSKSVMYCSHCYAGGQFTSPDITVRQMQDSVKLKLREVGFPGFVCGLMTRKIPQLERWREK